MANVSSRDEARQEAWRLDVFGEPVTLRLDCGPRQLGGTLKWWVLLRKSQGLKVDAVIRSQCASEHRFEFVDRGGERRRLVSGGLHLIFQVLAFCFAFHL